MERPMIVDIASRREELRELCRRFHVRRLDLFGSAAREDFDPARSDLDFLVEFDPQAPGGLSLRTFFGLKESLEGPVRPQRRPRRAGRDSQSLFEGEY
jgi:predicted nucleotidyltransferase